MKLHLTLAAIACVSLANHPAFAQAKILEITVTTTDTADSLEAPDYYGPNSNASAIWVVDSLGAFVNTIDRQAGIRAVHLIQWVAASGDVSADPDAVSGASRQNHGSPITATWDLTDRDGAIVPDGEYTIRMELADENTNDGTPPDPIANNEGTFAFTLGPDNVVTAPPDDGGFSQVTFNLTDAPPTGDGDGDGDGDAPPSITGGCNAAAGGAGGSVLALLLLGLALRRGRR